MLFCLIPQSGCRLHGTKSTFHSQMPGPEASPKDATAASETLCVVVHQLARDSFLTFDISEMHSSLAPDQNGYARVSASRNNRIFILCHVQEKH